MINQTLIDRLRNAAPNVLLQREAATEIERLCREVIRLQKDLLHERREASTTSFDSAAMERWIAEQQGAEYRRT